MTLDQITRLYAQYDILACDEDTEIHIFDYTGTCIATFSWYDDGYDGGEYRASGVGLGKKRDDVIFAYMDDHCSIRRVTSPEYDHTKDLLVRAIKVAHDTYWQWRSAFSIEHDRDWKELTDVAFAIGEFLEKDE